MNSLLKNCLFLNKRVLKSICKIIILACAFYAFTGKAQVANVVANGSFEEYYNCTGTAPLSKAKQWLSIDSVSYAGTYLSTCNSYVPYDSDGGYQYSRTGNSLIICGFYCLLQNCGRGYLKNRLKQNLHAGKTYCVKFYVNMDNVNTYGIDGFGAYFGDNSIDTITKCNIPLSYITPQVQNPSSNIITDTLNWVPITGTFTATGNEKYMLIGNFKSDAATDTFMFNPTNLPLVFTDVLIDDVSCIDIDLPADAGLDTICLPGTSVYIGRPRDVGIDEDCLWYQLPNMTTAIDTAAGLWVSPVATTTYVVKQEICGNVKWDTVVVHQTAVGIQSFKFNSQSVTVFPVPADETLYIKLILNEIGDDEFKSIAIYNNLGQLLREETVSFKDKVATLKTNDLENGVYVLRLKGTFRQAQGEVAKTISKRFVISR